MSDTIDVLITIDAKTIIEKFGKNSNPNAPTGISHDLIHLDAKQSQEVQAPGSAELAISARPGDIIRWRETTLSMNTEYTAILYSFTTLSGNNLISKPEPIVFTLQEPLPNEDDPLNPTTQEVNSYIWQTTVRKVGQVTYTFRFMILDHDGVKQGYYTWDPYIIIK